MQGPKEVISRVACLITAERLRKMEIIFVLEANVILIFKGTQGPLQVSIFFNVFYCIWDNSTHLIGMTSKVVL